MIADETGRFSLLGANSGEPLSQLGPPFWHMLTQGMPFESCSADLARGSNLLIPGVTGKASPWRART